MKKYTCFIFLLLLCSLILVACKNQDSTLGTEIFKSEINTLLNREELSDFYYFKNVETVDEQNIKRYASSEFCFSESAYITAGDKVYYSAIAYLEDMGDDYRYDYLSKEGQQNIYVFDPASGEHSLLFDWKDIEASGLPIDFIGHEDYIYHSLPQLVDGDTLYFTLYCMYNKMQSDTLTFRFLCSYNMQSDQFALVYDFAEENQAGIDRSILESGYFLQDGKLYFPEYPPHAELGWKARLVCVDLATMQVQYLADDQCPIYLPFFVDGQLGYVYNSSDSKGGFPCKIALGDNIIFEADYSPNDIASYNDKMVFNYLPFAVTFEEQGVYEHNFVLDITSILTLYQNGEFTPVLASRYNFLMFFDIDDEYIVWTTNNMEHAFLPIIYYDIQEDTIKQVTTVFRDDATIYQRTVITDNYIVFFLQNVEGEENYTEELPGKHYCIVVKK